MSNQTVDTTTQQAQLPAFFPVLSTPKQGIVPSLEHLGVSNTQAVVGVVAVGFVAGMTCWAATRFFSKD